MRLIVAGFVCAFCAAAQAFAADTTAVAEKPAPVMLTIAQGALAGARDEGIASFKGIPFAAPPVGPLRWRAPQAASSWQGTRAADSYGPICPQQHQPFLQRIFMPKFAESEDCLSLNVWTPDAQAAAKLPVMVWIYGGSFIRGGSAFPFYDGTDLAKHGVIVVTLNYRLGWLGFFDHPSLAGDAPGEAHGNYGLMDQIAALQWVKNNIAAFGGDPANVTIFGESAGGMSVNDLIASPAAHGLFEKAISESGLGMTATPTAQTAQAVATRFAERHGAKGDGADALAKLRALSVNDVVTDQDLPYAERGSTEPMIDGTILPAEVDTLFAQGKIANVPYMAGSNSHEASLMAGIGSSTDDMLKPLGDQLSVVRKIYDPSEKITDDALAQEIFGDALFASAAQGLADYELKAGQPAYVYRFEYVRETDRATKSGVDHGGEVPYVFGLHGMLINPAFSGLIKGVTDNDRAVVAMIQNYWTNFAKTGDPNGQGLPAWAPASAAATKTLVVGNDGTRTVDGFRRAQIALSYIFWSRRTGLPPPN
jgi:para-nitrobenzyl esterase